MLRRQVRVMDLPIVDHLPPIFVLPVEFEPEADFFWRDKAQRGEIDREIVYPHRQAQTGYCFVRFSIGGDLLDV